MNRIPRMMERVYVLDQEDGSKDISIYWHTNTDPGEGWLLKTVRFPHRTDVTEFAYVQMRRDQPFAVRQGEPRMVGKRFYADPEPPYDPLNEFDTHIMERMIRRAQQMAGSPHVAEQRKSRVTSVSEARSNPKSSRKQFSRSTR